MADPRLTDMMDRQKQDKRSDLMKAKALAPLGGVVNFCPFGCEDRDLDDHGYCRHLVGFTNDKSKGYEPMVWDAMRQARVVRVRMEPGADGKQTPMLEPCQKGDQFVQISISSRVYRKTDEALPQLEKSGGKVK